MRYAGKVGYGISSETVPGVWKETITERSYFGDVTQNMRRYDPGETASADITPMQMISVVADAYAFQHVHHIRYVVWEGVRWRVETVDIQRPRLVLRLGSVYNGPTP